MKLYLIAVGTRMPRWINDGFQEYARRLPAELKIQLLEIPAGQRGRKMDPAKAVKLEGERIQAAIPSACRVIALDVQGKQWSTKELAEQIGRWQLDGRDVALLVGGPEGLEAGCLARAEQRWSLSALTFPHPLVRVILAEQLYRAVSILHNHPYHRD